MKKYYKGKVARKTMTIKDVRKQFENYPENTPVLATWEGVLAPLTPENFKVTKMSNERTPRQFKVLVIDVETY